MKIVRETIENPLLGESFGEMEIDNISVPLPSPVLTATDVNYGDRIVDEYEIEPEYPHKLHEVKELWWKDKLRKIMNSEKLTKEKISWIDMQITKSLMNISLYTPLLSQDITINNRVKDFFNRLQNDSSTKITNTLDMPDASADETKEMLKEDKKKIEDAGKEPFILIDMKSNEAVFEKKLGVASEYMQGITGIYADPLKYFKNFDTLAKLRDSKMLRHLSNINMGYCKSAIIPNALLCADTFSPKLGVGNSKKPCRERIVARRTDISTCGYLRIAEHRQEHGEKLGHYCPIDRGNTMSDLVIDFRGNLYPAFRVHDAHAIYEMVEQAREKMNSGKLYEFLRGKKYGRVVVDTLFRIGQTTLV